MVYVSTGANAASLSRTTVLRKAADAGGHSTVGTFRGRPARKRQYEANEAALREGGEELRAEAERAGAASRSEGGKNSSNEARRAAGTADEAIQESSRKKAEGGAVIDKDSGNFGGTGGSGCKQLPPLTNEGVAAADAARIAWCNANPNFWEKFQGEGVPAQCNRCENTEMLSTFAIHDDTNAAILIRGK
mmetsp:Transcript_588/g.2115  ORF Transcript_588/g.2115 Transcript_588/m.2115 type:complete len:190 (+) Transcript_588:101-670(+)